MQFEKTVQYKNGVVSYLDQKKLPIEEVKLSIRDYRVLVSTIQSLQIRGAPAIGIAGSFGVVLAAREILKKNPGKSDWAVLQKAIHDIREARPTAVNLSWAVDRMNGILDEKKNAPKKDIVEALEGEAFKIMEEDLRIGQALAAEGKSLIQNGDGILTHCNAGGIATAGMGSALSVFYAARKSGKKFTVYVDETRPLLQGARLTTYELKRWKIPHVLICDNMAASLMQGGRIQKVLTGADRIAMNGDTANKIGTYSIAALAAFHKIPFYIAAPYSTFDPKTKSGKQIPIELRSEEELLSFNGRAIAPRGTRVYNPAFDVVPAALIRAIITERGYIQNPDEKKIKRFLSIP
ncbi:MAG: S-methyl-5-thioribose-1-phosphate isomerase [Spirochaetia bacterium]|nr:S-methyl-5-thioribose-1-phosphate isomerase [Spirochaetia bacterium]